MKSENSCKFNPYRSSDLICPNFIKERNNAQNSIRLAEHYAINLVLDGKGIFFCNGTEHEIEKGTLFLYVRGTSFRLERGMTNPLNTVISAFTAGAQTS
jgi:hypothetical protein